MFGWTIIALFGRQKLGRTAERGTCCLQPIKRTAFNTVRRPLVQTATGQDDDAGSDRTSERTTILRTHGTGDDKTLDAAASCKEPILRLSDRLLPNRGERRT